MTMLEAVNPSKVQRVKYIRSDFFNETSLVKAIKKGQLKAANLLLQTALDSENSVIYQSDIMKSLQDLLTSMPMN